MPHHATVLAGTTAAVLLLLHTASCSAAAAAWSPSTYPNPTTDIDKCGRRGVASWVCDPDGVVAYQEANGIEGLIKEIHAGQNPYVRHKCGAGSLEGYQVAVALMEQFTLEGGRTADEEAAYFAKALHDRWGVGDAACNNGIVLLLAVANRRVYISTGAAAARHVHNKQLDVIIGNMRPLLQEGRYGKAVQQALTEVGLALAGHSPKDSTSAGTGLFLLVAGLFGGLIAWSAWSGYRQRRRYRACKDKLEKIKRDQAAARRQQFTSTSCPICLEDYTPGASPSSGPAPSAPPLPQTSRRTPGGQGHEAEPLLAGGPHGPLDCAGPSCSTHGGASSSGGNGLGGPAAPPPRTGSQKAGPPRKPLYLRCGHSFCEPCIAEWVKQHSTCPICRKDITQDDDDNGDIPQQQQHGAPLQSGQGAQQRQQQYGQQQQYGLWEPELLFRLASLRRQYPWYVTPDMYDTWADDIRHQRELDTQRLLAFQLNDPTLQQQREQSGAQGTSMSFGGGSSGGGGGSGGSW